jgi:hypothetical protein
LASEGYSVNRKSIFSLTDYFDVDFRLGSAHADEPCALRGPVPRQKHRDKPPPSA